MKIVAVIPAHLASVRFPNKILFPFHGLPMIEHVRRRALLSNQIADVYVATCDDEIEDAIKSYGGNVIRTSNTHTNGTSRVAEAIKEIECDFVILLQGDEPLLLPRHLDAFVKAMTAFPNIVAFNATGPIENEEELDRHSFVKCAIASDERILYCFRRTPCYSEFTQQKEFIRKILGIIAYKRDFLLKLTNLSATPIELAEYIEQMRIIESGYILKSIPVSPSLPSVNEPEEASIVLEYINNVEEQKLLLDTIIS